MLHGVKPCPMSNSSSQIPHGGCMHHVTLVASLDLAVKRAAGHARVYISFDILFRFLKRLGFNVTYVR